MVQKLVVVCLARIPDGADHQWSITEASGTADYRAAQTASPYPG